MFTACLAVGSWIHLFEGRFSMSTAVARERVASAKMNRRREADKWAAIWFGKLCKFHRMQEVPSWDVNSGHVIQFLRSKVKQNCPAWRRLKIVEGLICYRRKHRVGKATDLSCIVLKLKQLERWEKRARKNCKPIERDGARGTGGRRISRRET